VLHNKGDDAIELHAGLPFQFRDLDSDWLGPAIEEPSEDFSTAIDEVFTEVREIRGEEAGERFDRVYLGDVAFEPGQSRTLTHTYRTYGGADSAGDWWFDYILTTAKSWNGDVGSVKIDFELPFRGVACAAVTMPHESDDSWVRVDLSDGSPEQNFNVTSVRLWEAIYQVYDMMPWEVTAEEACAEVPMELRARAQAAVELYFGTPQTWGRMEAAGLPPEFCSQSDMFAMARFHAEEEPQ
jgi:hypothetical protein